MSNPKTVIKVMVEDDVSDVCGLSVLQQMKRDVARLSDDLDRQSNPKRQREPSDWMMERVERKTPIIVKGKTRTTFGRLVNKARRKRRAALVVEPASEERDEASKRWKRSTVGRAHARKMRKKARDGETIGGRASSS
jgi:hypothetical protein